MKDAATLAGHRVGPGVDVNEMLFRPTRQEL